MKRNAGAHWTIGNLVRSWTGARGALCRKTAKTSV